MGDLRICLPIIPSTSNLTSLTSLSRTVSLDYASSGTTLEERAADVLLMTRHQPITCASTTLKGSDLLQLGLKETSPPCTPPAPHHLSSDDRDEYTPSSKRLFEGGDNGQGATEDVHETMTDSALIAHTFRLSNALESESMKPIEEPGSLVYPASCPQPRAATRSLTAGIEDVFQDPDEKLRKRAQSSLRVHDMLCNVAPCIIDNTLQAVSEDVQEDNDAHAILYNHRRTPHTIVLDSLYPDLAPHIVITSTADTWDDTVHAYDNRINPQNMACLFVPPFYLSTCRVPTYEEWKAMLYPPAPEECQSYAPVAAFNHRRFQQNIQRASAERSSVRTGAASLVTHHLLRRFVAISASRRASTFCRQRLCEYIDKTRESRIDPANTAPPAIFCPTSFRAFVEHTGDERAHDMTQAAVSATHRLLVRLEAIRASSIAEGWRSRYDDAQFLASVEKRFKWKWNDPAEPIFSLLGPRPINVTIIHSAYPYSAPHIVIHGTEPNDPWITWGNATDEQNCAYGNALVVVAAKGFPLSYVNVTGDESNDCFSDLGSCDYDEFGHVNDTSSCYNSPGPETPTELERVGSGFFSEAGEEDLVNCRYENYSQYISGLHQDITSSSASHFSLPASGHTSSGKFFIAEDEEDQDDDDLPEYDEWYWSIANQARAGGAVLAAPISVY